MLYNETMKGCSVFNLKPAEEKSSVLDPVIENLISEMAGYGGETEQYTEMAANLKTLLEARATEPRKERISPNTIAVVAGNIAGIILILAFEQRNIVTSKALSFVMKPKA